MGSSDELPPCSSEVGRRDTVGIGVAASPTPVGARADLGAAPSQARRKDATLSPHHTDSQGMISVGGREGNFYLVQTRDGKGRVVISFCFISGYFRT